MCLQFQESILSSIMLIIRKLLSPSGKLLVYLNWNDPSSNLQISHSFLIDLHNVIMVNDVIYLLAKRKNRKEIPVSVLISSNSLLDSPLKVSPRSGIPTYCNVAMLTVIWIAPNVNTSLELESDITKMVIIQTSFSNESNIFENNYFIDICYFEIY